LVPKEIKRRKISVFLKVISRNLKRRGNGSFQLKPPWETKIIHSNFIFFQKWKKVFFLKKLASNLGKYGMIEVFFCNSSWINFVILWLKFKIKFFLCNSSWINFVSLRLKFKIKFLFLKTCFAFQLVWLHAAFTYLSSFG
jgi:hypothetical protein